MTAINSSTFAALPASKIPLEFHSQNRPIDKVPEEHRDKIESSHGRRRASQIFGQEILQSLKIRFKSEFKLSVGFVNPYGNRDSAPSVAASVLGAARSIVEQRIEDPSKTLGEVRKSVDQALGTSRDIVNTDEGDDALDDIGSLLKHGLDELEHDTKLIAASSLYIESTTKQRTSIKIRTQEGDIVKFELRQVDKLKASDIAVQTDSGSATSTEVSVSSSSRFVLKVEGDLNEAELEAIRNVFSQAEQLAEEFFSGDIDAALQVVAGLEFDSEQLARVSLKFRSSEKISITQTILRSGIPVAAETTAPIDAESAALDGAIGTAVPASSVATIPTDAVNDTPDADTQIPESSLGGYLGKLADYLQQSIDLLTDSASEHGVSLRFEITESVRLDIFRAVLIETAPEETEEAEHTDGDSHNDIEDDD